MMHIYAYIIPKCLKKSCKDTFFPWQSKPFLNIFSHIHFSINRKKGFYDEERGKCSQTNTTGHQTDKKQGCKAPEWNFATFRMNYIYILSQHLFQFLLNIIGRGSARNDCTIIVYDNKNRQ